MRIALLLGGNILNRGIYLKMKDMGYYVFVVDWNLKPNITGDRHYQIDVKDGDAIINALKRDNVWQFVVFAYTSIDLAVCSVALIHKELGLKSCDIEVLKHTLSKTKMTSIWDSYGLLHKYSNSFIQCNEEVFQLSSHYKLIFKPDISSSSRGITILEKYADAASIQAAFLHAQQESFNDRVMIEEFVEGMEMTVELLGDSFGNVGVYAISKKQHSSNAGNNKIATKLLYNGLDEYIQYRVADYAIRCYKSLGLYASLGHLEIIMKYNGELSPVEIGARSSGFILSDLVSVVCQKDYFKDLIAVYNGGSIDGGFMRQTNKSAMYFFYDVPKGSEIKRQSNLMEFLKKDITSRCHYRDKIRVGYIAQEIQNDNERLGFEILEGSTDDLTEEYIGTQEILMYDFMTRENI